MRLNKSIKKAYLTKMFVSCKVKLRLNINRLYIIETDERGRPHSNL